MLGEQFKPVFVADNNNLLVTDYCISAISDTMGAAASTAAEPPPPSREDILESWLRVPLARRSQAVVAVETIVDEALEATQTYDVVVTLFGASSLPGTDGSRGTSDPYVVLKVGDATQTSDYIKNDENPNFSEADGARRSSEPRSSPSFVGGRRLVDSFASSFLALFVGCTKPGK